MDYPYDKFSNCSVELYTGSVCSKQLGAWQECTVGNVQDVMLLDLMNSEQSQEERERDAAQFLHYLRELSGYYIQGSTYKWVNLLILTQRALDQTTARGQRACFSVKVCSLSVTVKVGVHIPPQGRSVKE